MDVPSIVGRPITEAKADLFKALAHPARVRVLELLAEGERTMGELAEGAGLELSHLSHQVTILRRAGIVDSHRVRSSVVCTLHDPQAAELLEAAHRFLTRKLRRSQELLAALDSNVHEVGSTSGSTEARA